MATKKNSEAIFHQYQEKDLADQPLIREHLMPVDGIATELEVGLTGWLKPYEEGVYLPGEENPHLGKAVTIGPMAKQLIARNGGNNVPMVPVVGRKLVQAYAREAIDRNTKWCVNYNNTNHYRSCINSLLPYLKPEVLETNPSEVWYLDQLFYGNRSLSGVMNDVLYFIKKVMATGDGWQILFADSINGMLVVRDFGDFRVHEWERADGIRFRQTRRLNPTKGFIG